MITTKKRFGEIAAMHGLLNQTSDGWYGPFGLYGVERFPDGLLHARGTGTLSSSIGVTDEVAEELLFCWCPVAGEITALVEKGAVEEATNDGISFVRDWDNFAPITTETKRSAQ
jgi:hypothetical protein